MKRATYRSSVSARSAALLLCFVAAAAAQVRFAATFDEQSTGGQLNATTAKASGGSTPSNAHHLVRQLVNSCKCQSANDSAQCVHVEKVRWPRVILQSQFDDADCRQQAGAGLWSFRRLSATRHATAASSATDVADEIDSYHDWASTEAKIDEWSAAAPNNLFVEVTTIGMSVEGRPIRCVCMVAARERLLSPPTVLVVGGHHAREWISVEATARLVRNFIVRFADNQRIRALLHKVRMCIAPNINPDGYVFTWEAGWYNNVPRRMWRKNKRGTGPGGVGGSVFGVDINRNYGVDWQDDSGSSSRPQEDTYRGAAALSEPETRALYQFVQANHLVNVPADGVTQRRRIVGFISIHSYGNDIMFPLGYNTNVFGPNEGFLRGLGNHIRGAILNVTGNAYEVMKGADSYPCSGDAVDAVYTATEFAPSFTIETRPGLTECCGFYLKPRFIEAATVECFTAVAVLAEYSAAAVALGTDTWAHHIYNATYVAPVSPESNFNASDYVADWAPFIDGPNFRTKWLAVRFQSASVFNGANITSVKIASVVRRGILGLLTLSLPAVGVEIRQAAYLPSWDVFSAVVAFTSPSQGTLAGCLQALSEVVDAISGPRGRPAIALAFQN